MIKKDKMRANDIDFEIFNQFLKQQLVLVY